MQVAKQRPAQHTGLKTVIEGNSMRFSKLRKTVLGSSAKVGDCVFIHVVICTEEKGN